jgi:hypothetical protein
MAEFNSAQDLKRLTLQACGELTDGTSSYDSIVMNYLNRSYFGLLAGGDIFGVDVSEPWTWAKSKQPMIMQLEVEVDEAGSMTTGSLSGSFSAAQAASLKDWIVKFEQFEDFYVIRQHSAGSASFQIDQAWPNASGSYNCTVFKLEYDLSVNNIVIDSFNSSLSFSNNVGTYTANIPEGVYTPQALALEVVTQMTSAGAVSPTCSYNSLTRKFTVGHGGPSFSILQPSGSPESSGWTALGFPMADQTGSLSYTSTQVLGSILRLVAPMNMSQNISLRYQAPEDVGKIYGVDINSLYKKYPLAQLSPMVPHKFAVCLEREDGTKKVRFNSYPREIVRVEVDYIPVPLPLVDNAFSLPLVPRAYREYLSFCASYFLMMDKSDNRAEQYLNMAKAKLTAMVNDNRASKELTSNNYGRLVPRAVQDRPWKIFPG